VADGRDTRSPISAAEVVLLCWNVAGRVRVLARQLERVVELAPDLVCLQEVSRSTAPIWRSGLIEHGFSHVLMAEAAAGARPGRLSVLTAARDPLSPVEIAGLPWSERALAACHRGVEYVNLHSPISASPGLVKVLTHEGIHAHLAGRGGPRVLCGDLNTPRREHANGEVWTFARTKTGRLREERGERWDRAELALIKGLQRHGFRDAFRERHGPAVREISWKWARWDGGYRLDHLIVSAEVGVDDVRYLHEWRIEGLSDHSPLLARITRAGSLAPS
jgi:exonuclease III